MQSGQRDQRGPTRPIPGQVITAVGWARQRELVRAAHPRRPSSLQGTQCGAEGHIRRGPLASGRILAQEPPVAGSRTGGRQALPEKPLGSDPGTVRLPESLRAALSEAQAQRQQGYRGRFAPSPTGALHRGNLRTALLSWLAARRRGGEWLLRLDDLDTPRNRAGAEEAILADLRWLGLDWDGPVWRQSERRGLYATVLSALRRAGRLYPCRCSRRLLADISAPHGQLLAYPGFCRERPITWGLEQGRLPSWRLRLPVGEIHWCEGSGRGGRLDGPGVVGDVVLRRADGVVAYHLATAVDELWLGISEVVRGEDLWSSSGAQVAVMRALAAEPPSYVHVPLWRDATGQRLSKRDASEGLAGLRRGRREAATVIGELAASVGLVPAGSRLSARELLASLPAEGPLLAG